ncbi:MAG TPA: hypothetical protein VFP36_01715 [Usitatibacter sp.]|nr:hypothetical protein [Usitatibacter sp.]
MPVVVNEFEVVAEPMPAAAMPAAEAAAPIAVPPAFEVERIERFVAERLLRVWAH